MTAVAQADDRRAAAIDPTTGKRWANRTLWSVQCLRAIAALMVVTGHAQSAIAATFAAFGRPFDRLTLLPWGGSVDLFFVISGFVMVHASRSLFGASNGAATFLVRRLSRIVPLYWLVTTLFLLLLAAATWKGGDRFPTADAILASFAFLPFDTWRNGSLFPIFDLGWTLNYELFFYLLFSLFVVFPRRRALCGVLLAIGILVLVGTQPIETSAPRFWTRPIVLDFALGVAVGWLEAEGVRLPGVVRIGLALAATLLFALDLGHLFDGTVAGTVPNELPRVLMAGLPCAAVLAAATLGAEPARPRALKPLVAIGDASYSLYLLHPFALVAVEKLLQKSATVRAAPASVLVGAVLMIALVLALTSFRWLERPFNRLLRQALARTGPLPVFWKPSMPGRQR